MATLIFLHGRGERGNNLDLVKKHGPPKILENKDLPFIIASPQCPRTDLWWKPDVVAGLVDELCASTHRSGQSVPDRSESGRFRHLGYGCSTPRKVCRRRTGLRRRKTEWAKKFGSLPIWNFHGDADKIVPVRLSRIMVEAVEKAEDASSIRSTQV